MYCFFFLINISSFLTLNLKKNKLVFNNNRQPMTTNLNFKDYSYKHKKKCVNQYFCKNNVYLYTMYSKYVDDTTVTIVDQKSIYFF